ncbi:OmpA family protein [Cellulomonas humilata]|uniref:OmpA family protein n=1 Tax=Cellulomonas humilata TaxID=144055 RepID=A0A7Y6A4K8_9CELL|nr:OmpA family protein [Cellulomonas humilata]NUU18334.1 OmpA family protein [Cellulomonas humilata]
MSAVPVLVVVGMLLPFAYVDRADAPEPSAEKIERSVSTYSLEGSVERVEPPKPTSAGVTLTIGSDVLFAYASAVVDESAQAAVAAQLDQIPAGAQVTVEGHTDSRGGDAVNLPLSAARAEAVAAVLRAHRPDLVLAVVGKASSEPAVSETDEQAMARNRRVELSWAG